MNVANTIQQKLEAALSPEKLVIVDDSHRHAGHAGAAPGGETHFSLEIVSACFDDLSRLDRQRLVYRLLEAELAGPVHALALTLKGSQDQKK